MSLQQFLLVWRARFRMFAMVLGATVLAALAVSLLLPKSYKATASLLVDTENRQSLSDTVRPLVLPQERLSYLQTQANIITSERAGRRVVRGLQLADRPRLRERFVEDTGGGGSIEDWIAQRLLRKLDVETSQSDVIRIGYSSHDPRFAAAVANAFARAYVETKLELRVQPTREAAAWFEQQLKSLRANLEQAQARLTAYQRSNRIAAADGSPDPDAARLAALSTKLVDAQAQAFDASARLQQARAYLARGGSPDDVPQVLADPLVQKLAAELSLGESKLQGIASQLGVNHPTYRRQVSENRSLRAQIASEMRKVLVGLENTAGERRRREADLGAALDAQRERLLQDKASRNQVAVLQRDVDNAQAAYGLALQRFISSEVDSRASQTNAAILDRAVVPIEPSSPKLVLNAAVSLLVGLLLGIGAVMLLEIADRRVRSPADMGLLGDVPLLAVLGHRRGAADRLLVARSAAVLPEPK